MKYITYSFICIFLVIIFSSAFSGEYETLPPYLNPSALAVAKVKMMQDLEKDLLDGRYSSNSPLVSVFSLDDQPKAYKDRKKAFFRSLLLPGAGEYYLGKHTFAKTFFAAEITLWISYFAFRKYGKWIRDDALAFAATHSGAKIEEKPSQFFVDIGNYNDVFQYNDAKLRFGEIDKVYNENDYFWSWDNDNNRQNFENMRIAGDRALNRSTYVIGAVLANHLISAIHASWQTHRYNKKLEQLSRSNVHILIGANYFTGEISLNIQREF